MSKLKSNRSGIWRGKEGFKLRRLDSETCFLTPTLYWRRRGPEYLVIAIQMRFLQRQGHKGWCTHKISDKMTELKVDNNDKYREQPQGEWNFCSWEVGEMALKKILRIYRNWFLKFSKQGLGTGKVRPRKTALNRRVHKVWEQDLVSSKSEFQSRLYQETVISPCSWKCTPLCVRVLAITSVSQETY